MSTVTTTRRLHMARLTAQLGGAGVTVRGISPTLDGRKTVEADVPEATLQAAVDAHVFVDEDANRTSLHDQARAALAGNRTYLALANPTAAQNAAQVKALTRQVNALIRLAVNDLDGTD